jgi:L-rhamnose isomerase
VDLGHHLLNANIEQVVSRLAMVGRLGGFHFNDSKYGDDDLTTGSITPIWTDVRPLAAEARRRNGAALAPLAAYRAIGYRDARVVERGRGIVATDRPGRPGRRLLAGCGRAHGWRSERSVLCCDVM